jgi:hypothetical protein
MERLPLTSSPRPALKVEFAQVVVTDDKHVQALIAQLAALNRAEAHKEAHGEFESDCPGYCRECR